MPVELEIRDARAEDVEETRRVVRVTWTHTYRDTIPEGVRTEFLSRAYSEESLRRRISSGHFLLAVLDGTVVGFSDWQPVSETKVVLAALYFLPGSQGHGIGSRLLLAGLERFPSARKFVLRVERNTPDARRFHEAHGFRARGERVEHLAGHRTSELEMVLDTGRQRRYQPTGERPVGTA